MCERAPKQIWYRTLTKTEDGKTEISDGSFIMQCNCRNCYYTGPQRCARHAPTAVGKDFGEFPMVVNAIWCGDYSWNGKGPYGEEVVKV